MTIEKVRELADEMERLIDKLELGLDKKANRLQRDLLTLLVTEFNGLIELRDGKIINSTSNLLIAARLEYIYNAFRTSFLDPFLSEFASELLLISQKAADYFERVGITTTTDVERIADKLNFLRARLGISADNAIVAGGFLDTLSKSEEVKAQIRTYVLSSISTSLSLRDYEKGLKAIVQGGQKDGVLQSYLRRYAYDTYNQAHEITNTVFAEALNLRYFVYEGDTIRTSRAFCRKRAGKVFSTEEAKKWKNDPDLIDKKTKEAYNPLIERGRYNCRHFLKYISEELAFELRPDLYAKNHNS